VVVAGTAPNDACVATSYTRCAFSPFVTVRRFRLCGQILVTGPASAVLARAHVRAHQRARVVLFRGPVHAEPPTPASPCEQHHPSRGTHARLLFTNIPTILREGRPSYPAATSRRPRPRRRCRLSRESSPRPRPARRHSPPAAVLRSPGRADKEEWDEVIPFFAEAEVAHVDVHIDPARAAPGQAGPRGWC
jgi:hypothetical protein